MQFKKGLSFQDIPSFLKAHERSHDPQYFPEMANWRNKGIKNRDQFEAKLKVSTKHRDGATPIFCSESTPIVYDLYIQEQEKKYLKKKLYTLWETPISKCGFSASSTVEQIFRVQKALMVRYLRLNAVIEADYKEYAVKYASNKSPDYEYSNFKSQWYDGDGEKFRGLSVNFGRIPKKGQGKAAALRHKYLVTMLMKFYKRKGYELVPQKGKSDRHLKGLDLLVKKRDKVWAFEINTSREEKYKRMVINNELWRMYLSSYTLLQDDRW